MTMKMSVGNAVDMTAPVETGTEHLADRLLAFMDFLGLNSRYDWETWLDLRWEQIEAEIEEEIHELGLED